MLTLLPSIYQTKSLFSTCTCLVALREPNGRRKTRSSFAGSAVRSALLLYRLSLPMETYLKVVADDCLRSSPSCS
jgi:hypothetical protein